MLLVFYEADDLLSAIYIHNYTENKPFFVLKTNMIRSDNIKNNIKEKPQTNDNHQNPRGWKSPNQTCVAAVWNRSYSSQHYIYKKSYI